jgi:hypothetical protein
MKKFKYYLICVLPVFFSCKKLIQVPTPENQLTTDKVFSDSTAATAALLNIYAVFEKNIDPNYNTYMNVYTDELLYPGSGSDNAEFNSGRLAANNGTVSNIWSSNYSAIYACNQIIEQAGKSGLITSTAKALVAEAKFLRAFSYFYLVNSFGPVPLNLTTDVNITAKAIRSDTASIYKQITTDLKDAISGLPENSLSGDKGRATKWAGMALLARVYLYQRDWVNAEQQATLIINSGNYQLSPLESIYNANSIETILSLWTQNGYVTEAPALIPTSGVPTFPVTSSLLSSFETGDLRKSTWLDSTNDVTSSSLLYYPFKYKNRSNNPGSPEYLIVFRLAEMFLIRAEARAEQQNLNDAIQDLNIIRTRAGLPNISSNNDQNNLIKAVYNESRVEFCFEWGHRFLELKRTGTIDQVMEGIKNQWTHNSDLLPIPKNDLDYDKFLTQNPGY